MARGLLFNRKQFMMIRMANRVPAEVIISSWKRTDVDTTILGFFQPRDGWAGLLPRIPELDLVVQHRLSWKAFMGAGAYGYVFRCQHGSTVVKIGTDRSRMKMEFQLLKEYEVWHDFDFS